MLFEEQIEKDAREIILYPWITAKIFPVSSKHQTITINKIAKKYGLNYFRYSKSSAADIIGLYAPEEMKHKYVQKCCAQYLDDDVVNIVFEYLEHKK